MPNAGDWVFKAWISGDHFLFKPLYCTPWGQHCCFKGGSSLRSDHSLRQVCHLKPFIWCYLGIILRSLLTLVSTSRLGRSKGTNQYTISSSLENMQTLYHTEYQVLTNSWQCQPLMPHKEPLKSSVEWVHPGLWSETNQVIFFRNGKVTRYWLLKGCVCRLSTPWMAMLLWTLLIPVVFVV